MTADRDLSEMLSLQALAIDDVCPPEYSVEKIRHALGKRDYVEIELAQHADGRWMWSVSWQIGTSGSGYRIGPKWGRFAPSRAEAIEEAQAEFEKTAAFALDAGKVAA